MDSELAIEADDGSIDIARTWGEGINPALDDLDGDDVMAERDVVAGAMEVLAQAAYEGDQMERGTAESIAGRIAGETTFTKGDLVDILEANVESLEEEEAEAEAEDEDDDKPPTLMDLVQNHLDDLVVYQPTDASAEVRYSWRFSTGVEVETERQHTSANEFAHQYHTASGGRFNPDLPVDPSYQEDDWQWPQYIREVIKSHREEGTARIIEVEGVRTQAVDDFQQMLESKPATTDAAEAAQQQRAFVDPDDDDVVQVPNKIPDRVVSQFDDCNALDLQIELEKRGHHEGGVRQTQVAEGVTVRFWQVSREWLDLEFPEDDTEEVGDGE